MSINTTTNPKLLWPGQLDLWGKFYNQHAPEYSQFMEVKQSTQAFEELQGITGFGLMPVKTEGAALILDNEAQGFNKRFTNVTYAMGYAVTKEEIADNLYEKASSSRMPALARSMKQTIETVNANHLNRATDSSYTGADGVELLSLVHPNVNGGTYANELSTPADLSEASLEDICILIDQAEDDRGLKALIRPEQLIIHPNDRFTATRILKSTLQNDTANNATNALQAEGFFSKGYLVSHFLTDTDAWFVTTDCPYGLVHLERQAANIEQDNDHMTKNLIVTGDCRFSSGWVDPRGVYGSEGAA